MMTMIAMMTMIGRRRRRSVARKRRSDLKSSARRKRSADRTAAAAGVAAAKDVERSLDPGLVNAVAPMRSVIVVVEATVARNKAAMAARRTVTDAKRTHLATAARSHSATNSSPAMVAASILDAMTVEAANSSNVRMAMTAMEEGAINSAMSAKNLVVGAVAMVVLHLHVRSSAGKTAMDAVMVTSMDDVEGTKCPGHSAVMAGIVSKVVMRTDLATEIKAATESRGAGRVPHCCKDRDGDSLPWDPDNVNF